MYTHKYIYIYVFMYALSQQFDRVCGVWCVRCGIRCAAGVNLSSCAAMCCNVLQCVAVCCSVLQCARCVCCSGLWAWALSSWDFDLCGVACCVWQVWLCCVSYTMVCCNVLQREIVCCSVLQFVATCCSVLQCFAVRDGVLRGRGPSKKEWGQTRIVQFFGTKNRCWRSKWPNAQSNCTQIQNVCLFRGWK